MRVSSLSNDKVIDLISRYFVPVWYSRDNYQLGARPRAEEEELLRIDRSAKGQGGNVCVFLLAPDGSLIAVQMVQKASKPQNLIPLLQRVIEERQLKPRDVDKVRASAATPRTTPRAKDKNSLLLRVWTRFQGNRADYGLSQDFVELLPAEAAAFIPPGGVRVGYSWQVPNPVADKLYRYFYPPGPNWSVQGSEVVERTLTATVVAITTEETQIALRGTLKLSFSFANSKETHGQVTAGVAGLARHNHQRQAITSFEMISEEASYVWHYEGKPQPEKMEVAVQSGPEAETPGSVRKP
jgi:hypothetical protein